MRQFDRIYELTLAEDTGKARVIKDLRIQFQIKKTMRSYPNIATIYIFNPNTDTINFLRSKNPLVILKAGYAPTPKLIFKGRIRNIFINKQGVDRVAIIYAGDGEREWQTANYNKTLSSNVSLKQTVTDLFKSFLTSDDISIGAIDGLPDVTDKLLGQTLSGSSRDLLDGLAEDYNFQWSIQDGELVAVSVDQALTGRTAVLINQNTGMIGTPTITEIGADVTTLLNPELLPNRAFQIEADSQAIAVSNLEFRELKKTAVTGLYRAYEVVFNGDNRGNDWLSKVRGTSLNA